MSRTAWAFPSLNSDERMNPAPENQAQPDPSIPISPLPGSWDLRALGWNDSWERDLARIGVANCQPARVVFEGKQTYRVVSPAGEHLAAVTGRMLHESASDSDFPKIGDWVVIPKPAEYPIARVR